MKETDESQKRLQLRNSAVFMNQNIQLIQDFF